MTRRALNPMRQSYLDDAKGGWIPVRQEMLISAAYRCLPVPVARILDRIEIEHMEHAGKENGELIVTYDQFVDFGVSRRSIKPALAAAHGLGFLDIRQSEEWNGDVRQPNRYRLTYVPEKGRRAPTDEWKGVSDDRAKEVFREFQEAIRRSDKRTESQFPNGVSTGSHLRKKRVGTGSHLRKSSVTKRELPSTSATPATKLAGAAEEARPHKAGAHRSGDAGGFVTVSAALEGSALYRKAVGNG